MKACFKMLIIFKTKQPSLWICIIGGDCTKEINGSATNSEPSHATMLSVAHECQRSVQTLINVSKPISILERARSVRADISD